MKLSPQDIANEAAAELLRAQSKHGPMKSGHEGYAVILEELDELWDEVKTRKPSVHAMREEAIQVAAMALRFVHDVVEPQFEPAPVPEDAEEYRHG